MPSPINVARTFGAIMWGFGWSGIPPEAKNWLAWPLFLLVAAALLLKIATAKSGERNVVLSFVAAPVIFCFIVSYLIRPIWLYRTLAYIMPFLCLVLVPGGKAVTRKGLSRKEWAMWGIMALALAAFVSGLVCQKLFLHKIWDFRSASEFVHRSVSRREVVYVPNNRVFWCWCWYFIGPGSVNPVEEDYVAMNEQGVLVISSPAWREQALPGSAYWLVHREEDSLAPFNAIPYQVEMAREFRHLWVERVRVTVSGSGQ